MWITTEIDVSWFSGMTWLSVSQSDARPRHQPYLLPETSRACGSNAYCSCSSFKVMQYANLYYHSLKNISDCYYYNYRTRHLYQFLLSHYVSTMNTGKSSCVSCQWLNPTFPMTWWRFVEQNDGRVGYSHLSANIYTSTSGCSKITKQINGYNFSLWSIN